MNRMSKQEALKKVEIAIDKMIFLKDGGYGCEAVQRTLDILNSLHSEIESRHSSGKSIRERYL